MHARRTSATIANHETGATTRFEHVHNLQYLNHWATLEVSHARTDDYRDQWQAEVDASSAAIRDLALGGAA